MQRSELLASTLGAFAFATTFHTSSPSLRILSAVVALVLTIRIQGSDASLWWSLTLGTGAMLGSYVWMIRVSPVFFQVDAGWGSLIWIAFSTYEGSIFLFAHFLGRVMKEHAPRFSLAAAWALVYLVFPHIIPWSWANLFLDLEPLVLGVGIFGNAVFSLLLFLLATAFFDRSKEAISLAVVSLFVILLASGLQARAISKSQTNASSLRLGLVQSNLDPRLDFRPEKRLDNVARQKKLSEPLLHQRIDLLIWPESSVHFDYPENLRQLPLTSPAHPFPELDVPILFGTQTLLPEKTVNGEPLYYFSALLLGRNGIVDGRYDKHRLLPFAEIVPFSTLFPRLNKMLPEGYGLRAGDGTKRVAISEPKAAIFSLSLCYEDLFPDSFEHIESPSLLISLINDAWFLDSAAAEQHYFLSRLRAVEQGKYMVRVTMNGITAVVSPFGAEVMRLPGGVAAIEVADVPLL